MTEQSSRGGVGESGHYYSLPRGAKLFEFEIDRTLGHGGFGITYLATDTLLQEPVAIKEYLPNDLAIRATDSTVCPKSTGDQASFKTGLQAFLEEARLVARIRHTNVIRVRRFFEFHGTGYIVQDYEDGANLGHQLQGGPLPEAQVRQILAGVLDGLQVVHERAVLHRDLKPSNIMLRRDGVPVLIDFGAARDFSSRHSRSVTAIATPGYTPPEQFGIGGQQGPWTDIYALGAVLYRCVTGGAPVDSLRRLRNDPLVPAVQAAGGKYDPKLLALIDWMMRVNETDRPESVAAVRTALADGRMSAPVTATASATSLTIRPLSAGHVVLEFDASTRADVLELAFFANPPGRYLSLAADGKTTWRDQPDYLEVYRTGGAAARATFAVGPQIVNAIPVQSQVTLSSADGFIRATAAWTGVPGAAERSAKPKRWGWAAAAALVVALIVAAGVGLYAIHRNEAGGLAAAGDDLDVLRAYLRDCRVCANRSQVQDRIAAIEERQRIARLQQALANAEGNLTALESFLAACGATCPENLQKQAMASVEKLRTTQLTQQLARAGSDLAELENFLKSCGATCPENLLKQAKERIEAANRKQRLAQEEQAVYKAARGNATALKNYLSACVACTFAEDARREIASIQRQQEDATYRAARGTVSLLQTYVSSCAVCEFGAAAREEITYLSSRGSVARLEEYLRTCVVCEFSATARSEIASIKQSESPAAKVQAQCPNLGGSPISGTVNLSEFFLPDPSRRRVVAGGSQDLNRCNSSWKGWVSSSPDLHLQYRTSGGSAISIAVQSGIDTVVLVRDPTGTWHFDDDSGQGLNGKVRIQRAPTGRYEIWVGTYDQGRGSKNPSVTVLISEN